MTSNTTSLKRRRKNPNSPDIKSNQTTLKWHNTKVHNQIKYAVHVLIIVNDLVVSHATITDEASPNDCFHHFLFTMS